MVGDTNMGSHLITEHANSKASQPPHQYLTSRSQGDACIVMSGKVNVVVDGGLTNWGICRSLIEKSFARGELREGIGNPLQCSCLENPMDGGACVGCSPWGR